MKNSEIYYSVGALLYSPANRENIANSIISQRFGNCFSLALCLEDTINDAFVSEAEEQMLKTLRSIYEAKESIDVEPFYIPKIFIRIRDKEQIHSLISRAGEVSELITGFVIPKFNLSNADSYIDEIMRINENSDHTYYMMPIFEDASIINPATRSELLCQLKSKLDQIEPLVLNIRVGGNDLCHQFGFRRSDTENIYQILPIADILSSIITVFGQNYVISGPVWEYYNGDNWQIGLMDELEADRRVGFIGKTAIHPQQVSLINESLKVSAQDYADAKEIINWDSSNPAFVSGNISSTRMNEVKTHSNWACKIMYLAHIYGIKE